MSKYEQTDNSGDIIGESFAEDQEEIEELKQRIAQLECDLKTLAVMKNGEIGQLKRDLAAARERERVYRGALEKYADESNWVAFGQDTETGESYNDWFSVSEHGYKIAQAALTAKADA